MVDVASTLGSEIQSPVKLRSKVFDDNAAALKLNEKAGVPSGTKSIHVKHWFFKEHSCEGSGIVLLKTVTDDQLSDTLTKGVTERLFVPLRNELMG